MKKNNIKLNWIEIGSADFKCKAEHYILRVEKMDKKSWWFAVFFKGEEIFITNNFSRSKAKAMQRCQDEYIEHMNNYF